MSAATSTRPVNFSAGPAILPLPVLEEASRGVLALNGVGLSILEISHRSAPFDAIIDDARERLARLMAVPDTHEILFLQGGARGQFAQVPLNFLGAEQQASYVVTGVWGQGAYEEAARIGQAFVLASGETEGFRVLPEVATPAAGADTAYVHTTSNNTIYGTQFRDLPHFGSTRHVCDMSSDIMSRRVDVSRFGLIYAGAQKNLGPAGVTLVIVDKSWMAEGREDIPMISRYSAHAAKSSRYNTPPTFAIWVVGLVARWLDEQGGLDAAARRNEAKAAVVYDAIAGSDGFYEATVTRPNDRSRMNVTWSIPRGDLELTFRTEAEAAGLVGLKGHRLVGGLRASLYNAMPMAGVERLAAFMDDFARRHG